MVNIYKIIKIIYLVLGIDFGIKLPAYSFLFHKPKVKLPFDTQVHNIYADTSFDKRERKLILDACNDMYRFTNEKILFNIIFELTPQDLDIFYNESIFIRAHSYFKNIAEWDEKGDSQVLGLCYDRPNDTKELYVVHDRLSNSDNLFRTTVLHELGHYLNMDHVKSGIMQAQNDDFNLYPNYSDAKELGRIWKCLPTDFKYFKG